jgi:aryl-alcohol dehydrogenase-like predicted oxidoreductase
VDPKVPIEDSADAMAWLVEQGKVRHIGLNESGARTMPSEITGCVTISRLAPRFF